MAFNQAPIVDRIRIIPRPDDFLDRNVGASGEVFFDKQAKTLRVYDAVKRGGFEVVTGNNIARNLAENEVASVKYTVTVTGPQAGDSGNKYVLNGSYKPEVTMIIGYTYLFDQSDPTNLHYPNPNGGDLNIHPLNFSADDPDGELGDGTSYIDGVTYKLDGSVCTKDFYITNFERALERQVIITPKVSTPATLYYWCSSHTGMGNTISVSLPGSASSYNDLSDLPTIPADVNELADDDSLLFDGNYSSLTGAPTSILDFSIVDGTSNQVLATNGDGTFTFVDQTGGGSSDVFKTVISDDGQTVASGESTLNVIGGTNISTEIPTDTTNVTINLDAFSIDFLSDVDTTSATPATGNVLKWDGTKWAPGVDATTGGAGTDADTLDGFDSSYYLDYNNFANTPTILSLTALSVGNELTASGNGAISYDNATGVFRYTPPTAAGLGAITAELNDLTSAVVWANVPDANITQSSVTQHQSSLSIAKSQITDLDPQITFVGDDSTGEEVPVGGTIKFAGANGASVAVASGVITITASGGGSGGDVNQNAFSNVAVSGQTTVAADTTTDTLTLVAGSGISLATNPNDDSITITNSQSAPPANITDLSDVTTAGVNIAELYESAIVTLRVDNNGTSSYTFNSHYTGDNPTIFAISGLTIAFDLSGITGHPFEIQNSSGTAFNTGLVHVDTDGTVSTGANAQGKDSGVLYWRIPIATTSPPNYRYQCTSHAAMVGAITIKDLALI